MSGAGGRDAAGANAAEQGVALCQRLVVGAAGGGARRPEGSDELIEMRAAHARLPLDELEAVG